ncbi:MAG: type II toxin-antitoxin system VapC family toxin [Desulfobacterales bacterium]|nr:type II toxin-antitoxin system VapC family toxin [Desulfobacterales bacterium]MBU0989002.1 type II toxin-antitoxin system VapC family toxin [Pseudomonadota bacterium]
MIFLPDTNVWIRFLNPGENLVKDRFLSADPSTIWLCAVVKAELFFGAMKSSRIPENLALLDELFADFESVSFDDAAARKYGEIRSDLARKGTPIGPNDLMIAAIASVHEAVLVTNNTREFNRVTGLKVEDWE